MKPPSGSRGRGPCGHCPSGSPVADTAGAESVREPSASRNCWSHPSTPSASMAANVTPSLPGAPLFAFAAAYAARSVSSFHTWTDRPQNRQDGSAFALA